MTPFWDGSIPTNMTLWKASVSQPHPSDGKEHVADVVKCHVIRAPPRKGYADAAGVPGGEACQAWGILGHQSTGNYYTPERVWGRSGGGVGVGGDSGRGNAG